MIFETYQAQSFAGYKAMLAVRRMAERKGDQKKKEFAFR
jgi:hypothetical protein